MFSYKLRSAVCVLASHLYVPLFRVRFVLLFRSFPLLALLLYSWY